MPSSAPSPKLSSSSLYFGENGRVHCGSLRCAGGSAHFSGRSIDGKKVSKITKVDNRYWLSEFGRPASCESCSKEFAA